MRRLQYSINVTLDGCCDHRAGVPDPEMHQFWADVTGSASVLLYGRVTYQMMEEVAADRREWRSPPAMARLGPPLLPCPFAGRRRNTSPPRRSRTSTGIPN